ncbi:Hypothetical predicted protein [Lecanosticta acicola]|uniref:Uncharacterized protein n=1 Tax=Lecanosticta acicola TaxID=111012 RepID=A0AAI8W139_9PEZI|nr:Hypothetical predicted protein [Lecanosticta acicola]
MARISDVMTSDRDTSPDPITLPSSPLGTRSAQSRKTNKSAMKPSPRKTPRRSATPSKSMVLDTPNGDASPWRIKVTVEAEPREGSPGKRISKTTTLPLQGSAGGGKRSRSGSPVKRAMGKKTDVGETKRPARKRKGTPIRERRSAPQMRPSPQTQTQSLPQMYHQPESQPDQAMEPATEQENSMPPPSHSRVPRASSRMARFSSVHDFDRYKRLSVAREELGVALEDAVGHSSPRFHVPGDKTVSMNEDFSIISVDSLRSAKEASFSRSHNSGETSAATVSYLPSSPPKPQYPDLANKAVRARSSLANEYNSTSWRPTGPANRFSPQVQVRPESHRQSVEQQWQRERQAVSRQIDKAGSEHVVVVDGDGDVDGGDVDADDIDEQMDDNQAHVDAAEEDLWQGEASRSLEEGQPDDASHRSRHRQRQDQDESQREERFEDLFAGQPSKPLRSKIPRTWRRSSGMDFSYVDSPAHRLAAGHGEQAEEAEERRHSTDGSGVLTPPSTDEDDVDADVQEADAADGEDAESEFQPDAEATRYRYEDEDEDMEDELGEADEDGAVTPDSEASDPDEDDTGNFFLNNLPQVYNADRPRRRPERQKTMDLTELLGLDGATDSPTKPAFAGSSPKCEGGSSAQKKYDPGNGRPSSGLSKDSPTDQGRKKTLESPLRKSLLRSSKMRESSRAAPSGTTNRIDFAPNAPLRRTDNFQGRMEEALSRTQSDSQDGLLRRPPWRTTVHDVDNALDQFDAGERQEVVDNNDEQSERHEGFEDGDDDIEEYGDQEPTEPSKSYEERLNVDSPQKIRVNFNDSSSLLRPQREHQVAHYDSKGNSSLLAAKKQYPPLFTRRDDSTEQTMSQNTVESILDSSEEITLVAKQPMQQQRNQPGLLSRLSTTFWSAVIRPTGPSEIFPQRQIEEVSAYPINLLREVRHRYGVVSEKFPWDMCHMRTMHRMLNSLTSKRSDSIVPSSGPLPAYLQDRLDTWQTSITGFGFLFTKPHAYVVFTYMQILVPQSTIEAMQRGEIEWLGDRTAAACREYYGKDPRHGSDPVWKHGSAREEIVQYVDGLSGKIGIDFLARVIGDAVLANKNLEEREGIPFEELQRLGRASSEPEEIEDA